MTAPTTRFNGLYTLLRSGGWPLIAVVLLGISWLTFYLTNRYAAVLVEQYGPCPDVIDALGCARYQSRRTLPWYCVVVLIDVFVIMLLMTERRTLLSRCLWAVTTIVLVPSFILHGLMLLVCMLFAG